MLYAIMLYDQHTYEIGFTKMEFVFDCALSYVLQQLSTPDMKLKPEQEASILVVCKGWDVFVWLPTGFGKSVCYEVLQLVELLGNQSGVVLVISLLILLMTEHVDSDVSYAPPLPWNMCW